MRMTFSMVAVCFLLGGAAVAQVVDEVLVVAQRTDIPERDATAALLGKTKLPLRGRLGVRDVCTVLGAACSGKVMFVWTGRALKADEVEPFDLDLPRSTPLQILAFLREQHGVQAAGRAGVVCLAPKDEVKEAAWLELFDLRAALMPLRDFPGPELGLPAAGQERVAEPEPEPHTTVAGFDGAQIVQLMREHAARGTWDGADVSVDVHNGVLLVRQTERGHREVRALLHTLGIVVVARPAVDGGVKAPYAANKEVEAAGDAPKVKSSGKGAQATRGGNSEPQAR